MTFLPKLEGLTGLTGALKSLDHLATHFTTLHAMTQPIPPPPPKKNMPRVTRVRFQKFSNNGETYWQFRYVDPTGKDYNYRITRSTAQVVKNPAFFNDQRWCVAQQILMIRHKFRTLYQELANA